VIKKAHLLILIILFSVKCFGQNNEYTLAPILSKNKNFTDSLNQNINKEKINSIDLISRKITESGYINFKILKIDSTYKPKKITIKLNKRYLRVIIKIGEAESKYIPKKYLLKKNKINIPLKETEELLNSISKNLKKEGLLFFEVNLSEIIPTKNNEIISKLNIQVQDKKRTLDKIIVNGYDKFPKKFIKNFLKIKKEKKINIEELKIRSNKLNELAFSNELKKAELQITKDSTTLYLYIKKIKSNNFDGVLGFNTNEDNGKLEFTGYLDLILINNFNNGEEINLNYRSDENRQRLIKLNLKNPYIFKSSISSETEVSLFTKDSTFTTSYFSQTLKKEITKNTIVGLGFENYNSKTITTLENSSITDYTTNKASLNVERTPKSKLDLNIDTKTYYNLKLTQGKRKSTFKTDQSEIALIVNKNFKLFNNHFIKLRTINKKLFSSNLIQNELYRFGGISSIRGFDENSIEAETFNLLNIEYCYNINNSFIFNTITDFGYFENSIIKQKESLLSLGLGMSTKTKNGIIQFIIATGKTKNTPLIFSNSKIHISLKTFF